MILWTFRIVFISVCLKQFSCSPVLRCHVLLALMAFRDPCFMFTKASVCAALPLDLPVFPRMCLISCCGLVPFQDCWGKLASNAVWSSGRIEFWAFFSISCLKSISCFLHKVWHSDIEQAWHELWLSDSLRCSCVHKCGHWFAMRGNRATNDWSTPSCQHLWLWAFACWTQLYQFSVSFAGDASLQRLMRRTFCCSVQLLCSKWKHLSPV